MVKQNSIAPQQRAVTIMLRKVLLCGQIQQANFIAIDYYWLVNVIVPKKLNHVNKNMHIFIIDWTISNLSLKNRIKSIKCGLWNWHLIATKFFKPNDCVQKDWNNDYSKGINQHGKNFDRAVDQQERKIVWVAFQRLVHPDASKCWEVLP